MPFIDAKSYGEKDSDVLYISDDGAKTIRRGGSRSWRNNNPGNMRHTKFTKACGAIGTAGGFAVFPDFETGRSALTALLQTKKYMDLSIADAIARYAPPNENDTEGYKSKLAKLTRLDINRKIGDLSSIELERVVQAVQVIEGYVNGIETPVRKVIATRSDGKRLTAFLIEGEASYLPLGDAVRLARNGEINAVVGRTAEGAAYLRAYPDDQAVNNFAQIVQGQL